MSNSKMTKRALLTSVMALVLCFAMLTGTTFAWFTDQETSGNNKIIAGNLDVELYYSNDKVTTEKEVTTGTMLFDNIEYWEPGAVAYENLTVKNAGNLALKYQLSVNFKDIGLASALKVALVEPIAAGTARADVIASADGKWQSIKTFTTEITSLEVGASEQYGLVIYWQPSDNDNAYNAIDGSDAKYELELGVSLVATQLDAEEDAFGKDYDKDAIYADYYVSTEADLREALTKDGVIVMTDDIAITDILDVTGDVTLDLAGHTLSDDANYTYNNNGLKGRDALVCVRYGASLTINDSEGTGKIEADSQWMCGIKLTNVGDTYAGEPVKLVINGGTITSATWYAIVGNGSRDYTDITINGGVFEGAYAAVHNPQCGTLTINGGTFTGTLMSDQNAAPTENGSAVIFYSGNLYINGGEFNSRSGATVLSIQNKNDGGYEPIENVEIKGGVYNCANVYTETGDNGELKNFVSDGYEVVESQDNKYYVLPESTAAVDDVSELSAAVANGGNIALIGDIDATDELVIEKDVVLDLNGKKLTVSGDRAIKADGTSTLVIKNGTVESEGDALGVFGDAKIEAENCVFNAKYGFGMNGSTTTENSVANFTNCEFHISSAYNAAYISAKGTYTFTNCVLEGGAGVLVRSGNVTLDGCTIIANGYMGKGNDQTAVYANYDIEAATDVVKDGIAYWDASGSEKSTGDCVVIIDNSGSGYDLKSVTIKNCKFDVVNSVEVEGETVATGYAVRYLNRAPANGSATVTLENNTDMNGNAISEGTIGLVYSTYNVQ